MKLNAAYYFQWIQYLYKERLAEENTPQPQKQENNLKGKRQAKTDAYLNA